MATNLKPNDGKHGIMEVDGVCYLRLPIRTHLITEKDHICDVAQQYGSPLLQPGDVLFISEKCVACTQRRAIPMAEIKPRKLAYRLSAHVTKTPHGIGLGMPETMECALRECGTLRILFAAFVSVIGKKLFHKKGWFYKIAGYKARSIDGPCHNTIPPYNHYVVLGPEKPDRVAAQIKDRIGFDVCIVDINDLEGQILGVSSKSMDKRLYARILKDNPLGQDDQQTPMGIIRRVDGQAQQAEAPDPEVEDPAAPEVGESAPNTEDLIDLEAEASITNAENAAAPETEHNGSTAENPEPHH